MDIGTILGLILGGGAIVWSILLGSDLGIFVDIPSVVMVGGGMIATTLIKWPLETVKGMMKFVLKCFIVKPVDMKQTLLEIGSLADLARRESVFALEKADIADQFMKKAMRLAADNRPPEVISSILQGEIDAMASRHKVGADLMGEMAVDAPAFGMIGTLVGLVQMLQNLSDPSSIGPAMAVALLTTFYGSIAANLFCGPFKAILIVRSGDEVAKMNLIVMGTLGIVAGENPRLIKEKLASFLPPSERPKEDDGEKE